MVTYTGKPVTFTAQTPIHYVGKPVRATFPKAFFLQVRDGELHYVRPGMFIDGEWTWLGPDT